VSTGTRVPLSQAEPFAKALVEQMRPACERIEIAGSIRRRSTDVGDIEIVAIPAVHEMQVSYGLFEERTERIDKLTFTVDAMVALGTLAPHPTDPKRGDRYSKLWHPESGLQVDLFSVLPPASWGVVYTIRTGPADFSHWLVVLARERHLHVAEGQLHRGGLSCGAIPCEVVPTPEESDFFRALGIAWRPPGFREGRWR
jgi:DNA polymerase/3'-5' exonuclease PolX